MKIVRDSSIEEYAQGFWRREAPKNAEGARVWRQIEEGKASPAALLRRPKEEGGYPYKLPGAENTLLKVVILDSRLEVENLMVHPGMSQDEWMKRRNLAPDNDIRNLAELARLFIERQYFSRANADGTQVKCFRQWKAEGNLDGAITSESMPLIELVNNGYEIVDGWGRLLPFVALLQLGFEFVPIPCFLASSIGKAGK